MRVRKVGSVIAGATLAIGMIVGGAHAASMKNRYTQTNLTSDGTVTGTITDAHLLNPWGLTYFPGGPFWISDNNGGVSTLYDGLGNIIPLVVNIPAPPGSSAAAGSPTGIVFNANAGFFLIPGTTDPTFFIFATEDGTIAAWSETFDLLNAHIVVDNSQGGSAMGAVYKGLAMGNTSAGTFLYATDFRSGKVDVFDTSFTQVTPSGSFKDPKVPAGWAPFGVTNIRGNLFVTWVMQDAAKHDPVNGKNSGYISIFDTNGNLIKDFAAKTHLNSPWGVVEAPYNFGSFSGDLLVSNFGDGTINAYSTTGKFDGQMLNTSGKTIALGSLWALVFGGAQNSDPATLYFTTGLVDEGHGLFGALTPEGVAGPSTTPSIAATPTPDPTSTPKATPTPYMP